MFPCVRTVVYLVQMCIGKGLMWGADVSVLLYPGNFHFCLHRGCWRYHFFYNFVVWVLSENKDMYHSLWSSHPTLTITSSHWVLCRVSLFHLPPPKNSHPWFQVWLGWLAQSIQNLPGPWGGNCFPCCLLGAGRHIWVLESTMGGLMGSSGKMCEQSAEVIFELRAVVGPCALETP